MHKKVFIKTFGCQMNEYDSNRIYDAVKAIGYNKTENQGDADCYILNTCHIRDKAKDKVYHEIGRVKKLYKDKKKPIIVVAGCVAQAENTEMLNREKYIDLVIGPQSYQSINKVIKKHGVRNLGEKQAKLIIQKANKNDIQLILGPPSTKSTFDSDIWIYIEREITNERLIKLGKQKLLTNNVLILEINTQGQLVNKQFYDMNDMNEIKLSSLKTENKYGKKSFVYDFLSSMRQKINDPLGKRKKP